MTAFCPISQIDVRYVENPAEYLEQVFQFRIIEFSSDGRNIVVSRRALLEEELQAQVRETKERLTAGVVLDGMVKKIMPYGAFVDVGGMDGLVHISEMAWDRVEDASSILEEGNRVRVKVLSFDEDRGKLALSIKQAGADPWVDVEERFPVGTVVAGTVIRVEPYGGFVRIAAGIEGLVHVSDMTWVGRLKHAAEMISVGDSVQITVLSIDMERKRISLGMKQLSGDPFDGIENRYAPGKQIVGTVQRIGAGGVFVELEEGIVAFLPGSLAGTSRGEPLGAVYKLGKSVRLRVREVDPERRRITLEAEAGDAPEERDQFEQYVKKQGVVPQKLGSFGELLQKALNGKDQKK